MNRHVSGWGLFGLAVMALLHMVSQDLAEIQRFQTIPWTQVASIILEQISVVGASFISGQIVPSLIKAAGKDPTP